MKHRRPKSTISGSTSNTRNPPIFRRGLRFFGKPGLGQSGRHPDASQGATFLDAPSLHASCLDASASAGAARRRATGRACAVRRQPLCTQRYTRDPGEDPARSRRLYPARQGEMGLRESGAGRLERRPRSRTSTSPRRSGRRSPRRPLAIRPTSKAPRITTPASRNSSPKRRCWCGTGWPNGESSILDCAGFAAANAPSPRSSGGKCARRCRRRSWPCPPPARAVRRSERCRRRSSARPIPRAGAPRRRCHAPS